MPTFLDRRCAPSVHKPYTCCIANRRLAFLDSLDDPNLGCIIWPNDEYRARLMALFIHDHGLIEWWESIAISPELTEREAGET